jgi:hypothetical protein
MTIFDHLNSILYSKKDIQLNCDDESQFNSFMINKWISFYSPELNTFINDTANKHVSCFQQKQEQFDYYFNLLPRLKYKKINYIKKVSTDKEEDINIIPEFMSQREYKENVELIKAISK